MSATRAKLPVWRSVAESYVVTIRKLPFLLRVGWLWLVVAFAASFAFRFVLAWFGFDDESTPLRSLVPQIGTSIIQAFCTAAIAVPWHREILANAASAFNGRSKARTILAYALAAFGLETVFITSYTTITAAVAWGNILTLPAGPTIVMVYSFLAMPLMIAVIYLWCRFSLILPSVALDEPERSLRKTWAATTGNGWRILFGGILAIVPILLLLLLPLPFVDWSSESSASPIYWTAATDMMAVVWIMFGLAFLSISYRELVQKRAAT